MRHVHRPPFPGGPENIHEQGFHKPGRDVYQQLGDIAAGHRVKVETHRLERPALDEVLGGFEDRPKIADEVEEAGAVRLVLAPALGLELGLTLEAVLLFASAFELEVYGLNGGQAGLAVWCVQHL